MATRRKNFAAEPRLPKNRRKRAIVLYHEFLAALLSGKVAANKLVERIRDRQLELDYDDPNG
jgi:hypothetical protein